MNRNAPNFANMRMTYSCIMLLLLPMLLAIFSAQASSSQDDLDLLLGGWIRSDGGYVLEIKEVEENGTLQAAYFNPNPVHISKAQVSEQSGQVHLVVVLQDEGYPGSYYTLTYNRQADRLIGVYHHLGINKDFEIFFTRVAGGQKRII